ncbi:CHASE2 and HATPase_c domain-containing protein [Halobacteriovorax sp. GB3]|uniref:CHASE2 and HATPase_c domain-containing protein n=1 Tax=Halobacteriovorax sp. GB3 TaxID=2719615 RepID=UPI002361A9E0|nr:CHASE2 and HATPase_c domain-containing protein [Halobacteriovorax sp. GB3]MDD0854796.1 CHASE2 and HATPase_c domain-containing protein [Halobacteriovorax sp. GB3]
MRKFSFKDLDFSKLYPFIFTVILVAILFQYSFSNLESVFYDLRVKYDFGISFRDNIVIVTLDEESDNFLGESYPYTYATHNRVLKRVLDEKPLVINYLVQLDEPDSARSEANLNKLKATIKDFVKTGGAFRFGTSLDAWGEQLPPEPLKDLGFSLALINVDNASFARDDVSRKAILNHSGEDTLHLWTANAYRRRIGRLPLKLNDITGAYYVVESDATFVNFRYYTSTVEDTGRIKRIPFHRVVVGNFPKGLFKNKIVLFGPSYISNASDFVMTPYDREKYSSSKMSVHGAIMQSLIQNKTIFQLPRAISYFISLILGLVLAYVINRIKPTRGLVFTVSTIVIVILISYLAFCLFGVWIYLSHILLTIFVVYYIWVPFRAIGEYQRRYAIQEETKLLKKVENLKQNFISLMSHDLKTPVAKIAGIADVAMHKFGRSEPEVKHEFQRIIEATKELNKFITSILDLTKIESRNISLNKTSKDINTIIDSVIDNLKFEAGQKNVKIDKELSPLYPIQVDVILINRVISNLIENAIKYSGENTSVHVRSWDDEQWVYLEIKDDGVGIPLEDLENIFEKFYRVKNDQSHVIKGSGLGLYLVKYFVELHGGTIEASSKLGEGTTFTIKLINE